MTDVISLLERLGEDAALRGAPFDQTLTEARIDPALKEAIQSADQRMLEKLLGAQTNVCCGLHPAREDEEEEEGEEEPQDDEDDDDDLKSVRFSSTRAASGF